MTFQQLRQFMVIAQSESISEAARTLGVSQSALSQGIKKLEEELGYALFDRSGSSAQVNQNGERFLECVNRIFALVEDSKRECRTADGGRYELWLGMLSPSTEVINLCSRYMEQKRDVMIRVLSDQHLSTLAEMERADLLIGPHDLRSEGFSSRPLCGFQEYAVFPRSFLGVAPKKISLSAIRSMPLALHCALGVARPQIVRQLLDAGFTPDIHFIADSQIDVLSAMKTGKYLTVCPSSEVDLYLSVSPELVAAPIEGQSPESPYSGQLYISWNESSLNKRARGLLEYLLDEFASSQPGSSQ